jgi:hypothetical protein
MRPADHINKAVSTLANGLVALGFNPPEYDKPKWYQFNKKRYLKFLDNNNMPYTIKEKK